MSSVDEVLRACGLLADPSSSIEAKRAAEGVLSAVRAGPEPWRAAAALLSLANIHAQLFACQLLATSVTNLWRAGTAAVEARAELRSIVEQHVLTTFALPPDAPRDAAVVLDKISHTYVTILHKEWPSSLASLMPALVQASQASGPSADPFYLSEHANGERRGFVPS